MVDSVIQSSLALVIFCLLILLITERRMLETSTAIEDLFLLSVLLMFVPCILKLCC